MPTSRATAATGLLLSSTSLTVSILKSLSNLFFTDGHLRCLNYTSHSLCPSNRGELLSISPFSKDSLHPPFPKGGPGGISPLPSVNTPGNTSSAGRNFPAPIISLLLRQCRRRARPRTGHRKITGAQTRRLSPPRLPWLPAPCLQKNQPGGSTGRPWTGCQAGRRSQYSLVQEVKYNIDAWTAAHIIWNLVF